MPELIGNTAVLRSLRPQEFTDERFGLPTVSDILAELEKPGRDPRPAFTTAAFAEDSSSSFSFNIYPQGGVQQQRALVVERPAGARARACRRGTRRRLAAPDVPERLQAVDDLVGGGAVGGRRAR